LGQDEHFAIFCVTDIKYELEQDENDKRHEDDYNVMIKNIFFMSYDYELQSRSYITSLIFPSAFCLALQSPSSKKTGNGDDEACQPSQVHRKKKSFKNIFNANHAKGDLQVNVAAQIFIFAAYYENVTGMS